jgi:putative CocE/NonD family hydrolase
MDVAFDPRLPVPVTQVSPAWIPMPDGTRLAGRMWLPAWASAERPVPAAFELIPYRTRDLTALRDESLHGTFAANGYASVRIDIRGSGDSEGLIPGEYLAQELQDGADCIAWIAAQPWCTGKVGMLGNSWGGFNALQVAALRPPALAAIITSCSTDDRFTDDMHYMGGALLTDMLDWGAAFLTWMALPPEPGVTGPSWRDRWMERIELAAEHPAVAEWLRHQERDSFWKHGSVNEDYGDIVCPVLAVGGWQDGYSNAIPRLLEGLKVPTVGMVGPWAHGYPHTAGPGPGADFLDLALRWWDHWLRGRDTGIMDEPRYRVFLQEGLPPEPDYVLAPGRWVAEETWPSERIEPFSWGLGADGALVVGGSATSGVIEVRTDQTVGVTAGEWCPFGTGGNGPELPADQAPDDERSLLFDSPELGGRIDILGAPVVRLAVPEGARVGLVVARLCDVWPDGRSTRVTFAVRHAGAPRDPGSRDGVLEVQLNDTAYAFLPGHRIRLALSSTSWPMVWPEADGSGWSFETGGSSLTLPVRPDDPTAEAPDPGVPWRPPVEAEILATGSTSRETSTEPDGSVVVVNAIDSGRTRVTSTGNTVRVIARDTSSIREGDPLSARMEAHRSVELERPDGSAVSVSGDLALTADASTWHLSGRLVARESGEVTADRPISVAIRRRIP